MSVWEDHQDIGVYDWMPILDGRNRHLYSSCQSSIWSSELRIRMVGAGSEVCSLPTKAVLPNSLLSMISVALKPRSSVSWGKSRPWDGGISIPWWWWCLGDDDDQDPVALRNDLVMFLVNLSNPAALKTRTQLDCTKGLVLVVRKMSQSSRI